MDSQETLKARVKGIVVEALLQICGGGLHLEFAEDETNNPSRNDSSLWKAHLMNVAETTISFPNKNSTSMDGKPHDVEVRTTLALFHRCTGRKRKRNNNAQLDVVALISDLGVKRSIESPFDLAALLCLSMEESMRYERLSYDVRPNASGIICIVTPERARALRDSGRLPCPKCIKWCKGEKGLWWHQQMEHGSDHSVAAAAAAMESDVLAIVPYDPLRANLHHSTATSQFDMPLPPKCVGESDDSAFELVKKGDLKSLRAAIEDGLDPRESVDRNGASLLLWAAGSGHLDIIRYLIETCHCSPHLGQKGKRSFSDRTALHWSSRNGHLEVVQYLVETCRVDIDAVTSDGTTAFCWASWRGHLEVMKYLHWSGANVQKANSFGCNAVLWCAQGEGTMETMQWLGSVGLNLMVTNSNGHGALHKAAQRTKTDLCEWLCTSVYQDVANGISAHVFDNIGPDTEGCCPSDLAGMAGDDKLALYISKQETMLASRWFDELSKSDYSIMKTEKQMRHLLPNWIHEKNDASLTMNVTQRELNVWEPRGGVRRIQMSLRRKSE